MKTITIKLSGYLYLFRQWLSRKFIRTQIVVIDPFMASGETKDESHTAVSWPFTD